MFRIFLIIVILYFLIRFLFGSSVFRFLFGGKPASNQDPGQNQSSSKPKKTKKIISHDEGEYVDFEEIKDKDQNNNL